MKFPRTLFKTIAIFVLAGVMSACGGGTGTTFSQGPPPQPTGANYTTCIDNAGSSQWVPNWQSNLFQSNYEAAISALVNHVSQASYASKIGYIRVGLGRGGEILLPGDWNNSSSGVCYDGFVGKWNYTIGGTSASSSSWNAYLTAMLNYEASLASQEKLVVGLAPMTTSDDPTDDYLAGVAFANGIAFGNQGLQIEDTTGNCGSDWCNLFTNVYPSSTPRELQTLGPSCPSGSGCSGSQALTGPLPALLTFGVANNANDFEIYSDDWLTAYDPTSSNYAGYGSLYQSAISGAATSATLQVLFPDPSNSDIQSYVLTQPTVAGVVIDVDWSDIQPSSASSFDWTITDNAITSWINAGAKTVNLVFQNTADSGNACSGSGTTVGSNGDTSSGNCAMPSWMWTVLQ